MRVEGGGGVVACVTLYGDAAGLERLAEALAAQSSPVDSLYLVDNSPEPLVEVERGIGPFVGDRLAYVHRPDNVGVSGALRKALAFVRERGSAFLWMFDQDSVPEPCALERLLEVSERLPEAGLVCCTPLLEPDGEPLEGLVFSRFRYRTLPSPVPAAAGAGAPAAHYECDAAITSGSLLVVDDRVGPDLVEEGLFIDAVDFELCARLRRGGRTVVVVANATMRHALGATRIVETRFPRRVLRLPCYGERRLYYLCRNHTWHETRMASGAWVIIAVLWRLKVLVWMLWAIGYEGLASGARARKSHACLRGTWDGFRGRLGKTY